MIHHGRVHQVGTPRALYDDPSDLFVAGFIGDPPMNLLALGDVTVGARPEHILDARDAGSDELALALDIEIELLGAEWLIYGAVRGGIPEHGRPPKVIIRVRQADKPQLRTGERRKFVVKKASARFFDPETGARAADARVAVA